MMDVCSLRKVTFSSLTFWKELEVKKSMSKKTSLEAMKDISYGGG